MSSPARDADLEEKSLATPPLAGSLLDSDPIVDPTRGPLGDVTYTAKEERAVRLKLDLVIMPLLILGFFCFQLERGNVANALTDGFLKDVGITQNQFNNGQSLLFLGIILFEIPSNYVLQWVGPQLWISFQVLAFGLVGALQIFQKGYGGFLATRIMLGLTECGYIPGSLFVISTFYKRSELARRNAIFFLGNGLATATSGLFAYAILPLGKRYPVLKGWQWLLLIEGCMSLLIAIALFFLLPASPDRPRPTFSPVRYFSERERQILLARVVLDDHAKKDQHRKLRMSEIWSALANWRIWVHVLIAIATISQTAALGTYGPSLIKGFNFDTLTANALSSVAGWIGMIGMVLVGTASDLTRSRGPVLILGILIIWPFWIVFQQYSTNPDRWLKYGLLTVVSGLSWVTHPLNGTWLSLNCKTPQERSVAMAMFIMAANMGALIGAQYFRSDDAPLYKRAFIVCVIAYSVALGVAILQHVQYRLSNRAQDRRGVTEETAEHKSFTRYVL